MLLLFSLISCRYTDNNQPWKKDCCGIPTQVHPHLPGLTFNQYTTWSAAQKARISISSQGHHRGLCVLQCGEWLIRVPIFSTLFAIRVDKRHRYCMMEWVCHWCQIIERCVSPHKLVKNTGFIRSYSIICPPFYYFVTKFNSRMFINTKISKLL